MNKKAVLFIFCTLIGGLLSAQDNNTQIKTALEQWISNYKVESYQPSTPMGLLNHTLNDEMRTLDIYVNEAFSSQPFTPEVVTYIYKGMQAALPLPYNTYKINIYSNNRLKIEDLIPGYLSKETNVSRLWGFLRYLNAPWIKNIARPYSITKGLEGKHISLWASHGRYYDAVSNQWRWQRPNLYTTNEDLFTQSVVIPFLIPMLQNAGAVVYTPRERDWQTHEIIIDNDNPTKNGLYEERTTAKPDQSFRTLTPGFAHHKVFYTERDNPFYEGSARKIETTSRQSRAATIQWLPTIPESGQYAVYVSYASLPNSVDDATYSVYHSGIRTDFKVNQKMGGGTWVYLGTFYFTQGQSRFNRVTLTNHSQRQGVITADAVRFGGGMGNVMRGTNSDSLTISGYPRFAEAARYSGIWYGMPQEVVSEYSIRKGETNDLNDDINTRPLATNLLAAGSPFVPDTIGSGRRVPFEMALAVHSDAGISYNNGLFGSLAISTSQDGQGSTNFLSGISRRSSADFTNELLNTLSKELTAAIGQPWIRRELWDRNYSETRNPQIPSAILEMLSHQNFRDMTYGLDPNFKFRVARAVYKSILRYSNYQNGIKDYEVQPLPVNRFSVSFSDSTHVCLNWEATRDTLEPNGAMPEAYIVYQRMGDGDFDNGTLVRRSSVIMPIEKGVVYSYKVCAVNAGGISFPSEVLSAYRSPQEVAQVLVVNGFTRLSSPAVVLTSDSMGFDLRADFGVAYEKTAEFCGYQTNFAHHTGESDEALAGQVFAGNTFDFVSEHGTAIAASRRYSFVSAGIDAVVAGEVDLQQYPAIDLLMGLQRHTPYGIKSYKTFTPQLQEKLRQYTARGGCLLITGAYLGSDMTEETDRQFAANVLKYTYGGKTTAEQAAQIKGLNHIMPYHALPNRHHYAVSHPDVLIPYGNAFSAFAYDDGLSAGVAYKGTDYRVLTLSIPAECIKDRMQRCILLGSALHFLLDK